MQTRGNVVGCGGNHLFVGGWWIFYFILFLCLTHEILMKKWDPIGISEIPEMKGEYDTYIFGILLLLREGKGKDEIAQRLQLIEREFMNLTEVPKAKSIAAAEAIYSIWKMR